MTAQPQRPASREALFLWVMHRFAERFEEHAVVKGGMALRLLDSPRLTTDIDYVFVPFASKKEVRADIEAVLAELADAEVKLSAHSTMLRAAIRLDDAAIQIEASVASHCPSLPMATGSLAREHGVPSQVVRVITPDVALSHKLAAWNERRLLRDLYDAYFLRARVGASPDPDTLDTRLLAVRSRLPRLRRVRSMTRAELTEALRSELGELTDGRVHEQLAPLLPLGETAGLALRMHAALIGLAELLEG